MTTEMIDIKPMRSGVDCAGGDTARLAALSRIDATADVATLAALEHGDALTDERLARVSEIVGHAVTTTRDAIEVFGFRPTFNSLTFLAFVEALGDRIYQQKAQFRLRRHAEAGLIAQATIRESSDGGDEPHAMVLALVYDSGAYFGFHDPEERVRRTIEIAEGWDLEREIVEGIRHIADNDSRDATERAVQKALSYVGSTTAPSMADGEGFSCASRAGFALDGADPVRRYPDLDGLNARLDFLFRLAGLWT